MPTALIPFVWMAITAANPLPRPLNTFEILTLLIGGVTPERIEGLMRQRGSTCGVGAAGGLVGGLLQDLGGGNRLAEACQNPSPEMTAKFNKFYGLKEFEPLMNDDMRLQQMRQDMLDHRQMAVKDFRARLEANPRNSAVRIALAYVISSPILLSPPDKNSLESAVALLRDGIRLEPGEPRLHYWLGVLLNGPWLVAPPPPPPPGQPPPPESQQRRDEITGALAELNEAVKLKPDYAAAQCLLEGIYSNEGDYDDALVHGSECVRLKPGDVDARMEFAMTFES